MFQLPATSFKFNYILLALLLTSALVWVLITISKHSFLPLDLTGVKFNTN